MIGDDGGVLNALYEKPENLCCMTAPAAVYI